MTWTMTWRLLIISIAVFFVGLLYYANNRQEVGLFLARLAFLTWIVLAVVWAMTWVLS